MMRGEIDQVDEIRVTVHDLRVPPRLGWLGANHVEVVCGLAK